MEIRNLEDLFLHSLHEAYYVENRLVNALDEMATQVTDDSLSQAFANHRDETREQAERLEAVFAAIGSEPEEMRSPVLDGLLEGKQEFDGMVEDENLRNLYYIGAGMKTERIEMTMYESMLMIAEKLNHDDEVIRQLQQNVDEEEQAFDNLRQLTGGAGLKAMWDKLVG